MQALVDEMTETATAGAAPWALSHGAATVHTLVWVPGASPEELGDYVERAWAERMGLPYDDSRKVVEVRMLWHYDDEPDRSLLRLFDGDVWAVSAPSRWLWQVTPAGRLVAPDGWV